MAASQKQQAPTGFYESSEPEPHAARTVAILKEHPEIRSLIGKTPLTAVVIVLIVSTQFGLMYFVRDQPWWVVLAVSWTAGAVLIHSLFVMIHECTHNLLFKKNWPNQVMGLVCNLPSVVPSAASFKVYHIKHHSFQGVYEMDADLPSHWEAKLIGSSFIGKALWEVFFPIFLTLRPFRLNIKFATGWVLANILVQISIDVLVFYQFGPRALLYLVFSWAFSVGFHPLGARWAQRHFLVHEDDLTQETSSYYGKLGNLAAFNVGYHNEHHDFPSVPWNRLPMIKKTAPEFYDSLQSHQSWFKLWLKFLFDPSISLYSRSMRTRS
jgi:sphingolipid delta-4 desaturase